MKREVKERWLECGKARVRVRLDMLIRRRIGRIPIFVHVVLGAIRAAAAWQSGSPPEGRPYEAGADTSKIAMGGAFGQCVEQNGKLLVLIYWNAPLSPGQSQWHASEQECYGLLCFKRKAVFNYVDHSFLVQYK